MNKEKSKILIVDDSKFNQAILQRILGEDHTLSVAVDGNGALNKAKTEYPDIILLDIVLPGMNGFDVLTELKKNDSTHSIPVIIISAMSKPDDEVRGLTLGAVDYITKPFNEIVVKTRIETQLKILKQMRIIEKYGFLDTLTGIPNRRQFDRDIINEWSRAMRSNSPMSLLMIDVDHFKMYNDTHGHQQGDIALQTVAKVIESSLKRSSDIAARWGGEEFSVLLPSTPLEGALKVAEDIRANVESAIITCTENSSPHNVTVSTGAVSVIPSQSISIADIIRHADEALYAAKDKGRNRVHSSDLC